MRAVKTKSTHNWKVVEENGQTMAIMESRVPPRTQERFAHAFAAIDELLTVARLVRPYLKGSTPVEVLEMIDAAIAKAEGRE